MMELSEVQAEGIESANQVTKRSYRRETNNPKQNESQPKPKCRFCGYQHVPGKKNCPAYGKQHARNLIISGPVAKISDKSRSETRTGERNQLPRSETTNQQLFPRDPTVK